MESCSSPAIDKGIGVGDAVASASLRHGYSRLPAKKEADELPWNLRKDPFNRKTKVEALGRMPGWRISEIGTLVAINFVHRWWSAVYYESPAVWVIQLTADGVGAGHEISGFVAFKSMAFQDALYAGIEVWKSRYWLNIWKDLAKGAMLQIVSKFHLSVEKSASGFFQPGILVYLL
jgi:hypothetical protein